MSGNFAGRVVDANSGKPISHAWVLIKYELYKKKSLISIPMNHSHKGGCVWNTVSQTNKDGVFVVPPLPSEIKETNKKLGFVREYIGYSAYKKGYISQSPRKIDAYLDKPTTYQPRLQEFPHTDDERILDMLPDYKMIKDTFNPVDRNHYLRWSTIGGTILCEDIPTLKPYYLAIYNEMKQLAIYVEKDDPYIQSLHELVYVRWKND